MARFNPVNESEIFSCSFDCSVLKWDLRQTAAFVNKIEINESMAEIKQSNSGSEDVFLSTMTPSFVHSKFNDYFKWVLYLVV